MRILAFSSLFGQFTPIDLSNMKPREYAKTYKKDAPSGERACLTFVQVRVSKLAAYFFDDLDVIEVR